MHRNRTIVSFLLLSFALSGAAACKSEVADKPKAKIEAAEKVEPTKATDPTNPSVTTLQLTTAGSSVGFIGAKITGDHKGSFDEFQGRATLDGDKLTSMEVEIEVNSLTTDAEKLTNHMLDEDFFEVAAYPKAKFTSLSITEKPGAEGATHEVVGNLELKGKANKITFPATIEVVEGSVHGKAAFSIDRKQWDITYAGKPDNLIKDDVALELELNFSKA